MITIAVILCQRKASSQLAAIPELFKLDYDLSQVRLYINIEVSPMGGGLAAFQPLFQFLGDNKERMKADIDSWQWQSSWWKAPQYDQDQSRLYPIVNARNMAINYAMAQEDCTHLLFVDADVKIRPDGLAKLIQRNRPLIGGYVRGRGVHSSIAYVFGEGDHPVKDLRNGLIRCHHGTCGYMLIERKVFSVLRFRFGPSKRTKGAWMSEDPAFCDDAKRLGFGDFYVDMDAIGNHWDDPAHPLTEDAIAQF